MDLGCVFIVLIEKYILKYNQKKFLKISTVTINFLHLDQTYIS